MGEEHIDPAFSYTDANIGKLREELLTQLSSLKDMLSETQRVFGLSSG